MIAPGMQALLDEYNLDIDDVRWYCSLQKARSLLEFHGKAHELADEIWSGRLADALYEMEERFLADLSARMESGQGDEAQVRSVLLEVKAAQRRRRSGY